MLAGTTLDEVWESDSTRPSLLKGKFLLNEEMKFGGENSENGDDFLGLVDDGLFVLVKGSSGPEANVLPSILLPSGG